ncbi:hypothetical protein [Actinomadura atramentaria]|uniref:hypothetical protein n=1 Tax=Actinomadura atramentaria TaxID=1990 RepID=UPI0003676BCE|nr:hypothetical protein [Actinomadura atramentaria]
MADDKPVKPDDPAYVGWTGQSDKPIPELATTQDTVTQSQLPNLDKAGEFVTNKELADKIKLDQLAEWNKEQYELPLRVAEAPPPKPKSSAPAGKARPSSN